MDSEPATLAAVADIAAGFFLLGGTFFYVVGMVGLFRFPDVFTRMHAVSVSETLGVGMLFLGMMILAGPTLIAVKLLFILVLILFSAPVIGHALARAALHDGQKPLLVDREGRLVPTDPADLYPELRDRLTEPLRSETADGEGRTLPAPAPVRMPAEGGPSSNS